MDKCKDILQDGVFNRYKYSDKSEYHAELKTILSYEYDSLRTLDTDNDGNLKLLIDKFLNLGVDVESSKKQYESIRQRYNEVTNQESDEKLAVEINSLIADSDIINAWKDCMQGMYGNSSNLLVIPDYNEIGTFEKPNQEFLIVFRYIPTANEDPEHLVIEGLTVAGDIDLIMNNANETIKPGDRVIRHGTIVQKAKRTGRGSIAIAISLRGRSIPVLEIPVIPDNRPPIPSTISIVKDVHLIGDTSWDKMELLKGDTEMHTTSRDIVPVSFSSNLQYNENEVWIDFGYEQRETGGDKTHYKGRHKFIVYKQQDSNFKIKHVIHAGGHYVERHTRTVGKNHSFNSLSISDSYLHEFEFRVDSEGRSDNKIIGVRGKIKLSIVFDRR